MCGIAAIYDRGEGATAEQLERIARALRHRGPDGTSISRRGPVALVHTRLAVIDVAGGDQPFVADDEQTVVIANGEIYNHLELRAELEIAGHVFRSRSDCEVILHGFEQWGLEVFTRLNGMFGVAVWDDRRSRLILARDVLGVKPVYWWTDGQRVVAASEVKGILAAGVTKAALDATALEHLLAWRFVPSPRTLFRGISKLAPASVLIVSPDGVEVKSFRRGPAELMRHCDAAEIAAELREQFVQAVGRQMMSDVPYGAFLSGGVDSSAIVAAMAEVGPQAPLSFTIGFPGHGAELDERSGAEATARALGAEHHATAMRMDGFLESLSASVRSVEEPCGTASAPAALQLSRFTAESVKVVLSGQGADEPFGGYQRHQAVAVLGAFDRIPAVAHGPLVAAAGALPRNERIKRGARLLHSGAGMERLLSVFEITPASLRRSLTGSDGGQAAAERADAASAVVNDVGDRDLLDQALYLDTHLFLPDQLLIWGDKTSMASSLEQRVPFLDLELMRFVERVPARARMRGVRRKRLFREAISPLVPVEVLQRRKHPFATPYDDWLRSSLGDEVNRRFAAGGPLDAIIDPSTVHRLVREHRSGRSDHKRILYCLLEFSQWHRDFIEEPG